MGENLSKLSDEQLMGLYQQGELVAFKQLYSRHRGRLYGFLLKKTAGNSQLSQDLLQETFLRLHRQRDKYSHSYPFLPWLFTLCRNLLLDELKKAETQRQKLSQSLNLEPLMADSSWNAMTEASLQQAWQELPQQQQQALSLRYLDDWSFEDIAQHMKSRPQSVRQWVSRGLRRLRDNLQQGDHS